MNKTPPTQSVPSTDTGHVSEAAKAPTNINVNQRSYELLVKERNDLWDLIKQIRRAIACACPTDDNIEERTTLDALNVLIRHSHNASTRSADVKSSNAGGVSNPKSDAPKSPWIKTADRPPTEEDGENILTQFDGWKRDLLPTVVSVDAVLKNKDKFPFWMPIPPVPQQQKH